MLGPGKQRVETLFGLEIERKLSKLSKTICAYCSPSYLFSAQILAVFTMSSLCAQMAFFDESLVKLFLREVVYTGSI
jgi:hypothetical protein